MAMIKCPECDKSISDKAPNCILIERRCRIPGFC